MSDKKTRKRDIVWRLDKAREDYRYWFAPNSPQITEKTVRIAGKQVTVSEGHPWPPKGNEDFRDIGGDFSTSVQGYHDARSTESNKQPEYQVRGEGSAGFFTYSGPIYARDPETTPSYSPYPSDTYSSNDDGLDALGTTAIARVKPTNSVADLSVAAAEIYREGIPAAIGLSQFRDKTRPVKNAAGDYLAYEFGWKPLVSAVQDLVAANKKQAEIMQQYERDAGRIVRRRYEFPHEKYVEDHGVINDRAYPILGTTGTQITWAVTQPGVLRRERSVEIKRSFSGAFTYPLFTGNALWEKGMYHAAQAEKVYGLKLDPEVLWNLAPWSWAVDWVSNTGDLISNFSDIATDGLVMKYGYIMEETTIVDTYSLSGVGWNPLNAGLPTSFRTSFSFKAKKRRKATPFGFGMSYDEFTPRQWAIITALGITRAK